MTLILSRQEIVELAAADRGAVLDRLIDYVRAGYAEMAGGVARQHPRIYLRYPEEGSRRPPGLFSMSALLPRARRMGTRLLAITQEGKGGDGLLVLFDHETSRCLAILDDSVLHNYRTGAPAAVATSVLARPESAVLACIGSSGIAQGAVAMVARRLPELREVRVYSPTKSNRERFAAQMEPQLGIEVRAVGSAKEAAAGADVIVTATDADRPVVDDADIDPGTHVNLMARNEIEMATFERARVVRGSSEMAKVLDPPWSNPIPDEWIDCEVADIVGGGASQRTTDDDVTVFIGSSPLAMWDVAAASAFFEAATDRNLGTDVPIAA